MRIVRGLGGMVLWLVASLVWLVAIILCVTVILLPVGVALFGVGRRLFGTALKLMLPRPVTHPVDELSSRAKDLTKATKSKAHDVTPDAHKLAKRSKKGLKRRAKALPL
jgi:hypothetical protein